MEKTEPVAEQSHAGLSKPGTARVELWAIGVVGALALLALGIQIGMGMGHVIAPVQLRTVTPADCPITLSDIQITQAAPEASGYRSWRVDATVANTGLIPTGPMTAQVDFDDASVVPLRAYKSEARGAGNLLGSGDLDSLPRNGTAPVFLGGDDRVNTYRKYPAFLEVTVHLITYHFPLPKPLP